MSTRARWWVLVVAGVAGTFVGGWAALAPRWWYDTFPGFGLSWIPVLGPFNEHLVVDVGALYLALSAMSFLAARWVSDTRVVRIVGVGWLVFGVPHLLFHVVHLGLYPLLDQVLNMVTLGGYVVLGAVLAFPGSDRRARTAQTD